jgi:cytochrome P450
MEQMVADEKQHIAANQPKENGNLLQSFVIASQSTDAATHIPDPAVFGNLFIFILAGHETSANTMTFALSLLACRPNFQRALQADIDRILGDRRDPALWAYPQDYTRLMDGYIGALMNETLRLYTVLPFFPKTNPQVQTLTIDGAKHVLAANTLAMINTSAVHRHPKYWTQPSASSPTRSTEGAPYNLSSFRPEFWLDKKSPVPGSFIPFAEGFRACMGSRFARVEFCAALATICHDYEVQLIEGTGENALRNGANRVSEGVGFEMGMKMKEAMGLRFVKRS